jgi:hypothetical protein
MTEKREFFNRVQPKLTAFAIELNEKDGLSVAEVADALMSAAIAISVGVSGRERTVMHLGAVAAAVAAGRFDNAAKVESHPLS